MTTSSERVPYDEFAYFADNADEFGIPYGGPPAVRRTFVEVAPSRRISALVWGSAAADLVLLHGGAQNAHTWDTVALALDRPLVAVDLPGHGHSDAAAPGVGIGRRADRRADPELRPLCFGCEAAETQTVAQHGRDLFARPIGRVESLAADVAVAVTALAPAAAALVGMSLGGLTAIALADSRPELVRRLVLVDITPGVNRDKAKAITDFVRGPATFASFDELLARTIEHNPTRTEASLRRGILHNAEQQDDGTWRWRYRRHDDASGPDGFAADDEIDATARMWGAVGRIRVPVMLARGMRAQSVVDDADEDELRRRLPHVRVERFAEAGHSVQGDMPVELAHAIAAFVDDA